MKDPDSVFIGNSSRDCACQIEHLYEYGRDYSTVHYIKLCAKHKEVTKDTLKE